MEITYRMEKKEAAMTKLGFILNPVAGMGGRVGLKGTDGQDILARARAMGATPEASPRGRRALEVLAREISSLTFYTASSPMGADEGEEVGFQPHIVHEVEGETGPKDTRQTARALMEEGVDLILFVGGDGTARDIMDAVDQAVPVLGVPAGVKMHSGVFATDPNQAGVLAAMFLKGDHTELEEKEVMDLDEQAFRMDQVSAHLYGVLSVPLGPGMLQDVKSGTLQEEKEALRGIGEKIVDLMERDVYYFIGPGTSTRPIMEELGLQGTLLGVDIVRNGQLIKKDACEQDLLDCLQRGPARIVVTIIGGQGFIFGRGNQQFSPRVLARVGQKHIMVVASQAKLMTLKGRPLLVDTGDGEMDALLQGYWQVRTSYSTTTMMKVAASGSA